MEMNTRLQVEHPVTEAITGEDLVEWQLRVASGEPLPKRQEELAIRGHAFEARLYAEDPARGFLPAIGMLTHLEVPAGVRVDSGVRAGDAISPWYDPMIAKVVSHGPTRATALAGLARGLDGTRVAGCTTNLGFLARLARDPGFARGEVDTGLIERAGEALVAAAEPDADVRALAALAAAGLMGQGAPLTGFALWAPLAWTVRLGPETAARVEVLGPGRFQVDGRAVEVLATEGSGVTLRAGDGGPRRLGVVCGVASVTVFDRAEGHSFALPDPLAAGAEAHHGGDEVRAPMPGLVKHLAAVAGAGVAKGDVLVVLEAMKMEHALTAPRDGVVAAVHVAPGAQVTDGTLLLALEPEDG
jgi:3-methylcrotonyl-CoA carboxylase alpha subunit